MSVLSGCTVGPGREFELRTGASRGGGRIYEVDPEVVANFKAKLAEQQPARKPRRNGRVDVAVQKRIEAIVARAKANSAPVETNEPEEVCEPVAETVKWTDEMVQALHGRYMAGESVHAIGKEVGESWQGLLRRFNEAGLPRRPKMKRGKIPTAPKEAAPKKATASAAPAPELEVAKAAPKKKPVAASVGAPTVEPEAAKAIVPAQATAVAAPTHPGDLRQQLIVIQDLLSLAEAQSIALRGKISVELHAEVVF